jgi:hypothetical protein
MFAAILSAKQIRVLFCIFCAGLLAVGAVAVAQQPPNWDWCMGKNNPTFEQRVSACTAIIEWDAISPADKAKALGNRGVAAMGPGADLVAIDSAPALNVVTHFLHRLRPPTVTQLKQSKQSAETMAHFSHSRAIVVKRRPASNRPA